MEKKREIIKGEIKKEALFGNDEDKEKIIIQVKEELDKEKAREYSIKEGKFAAIAQGTGHSYVSPFALALGANNLEIGILTTIPRIIAPIAQLFGSRLLERKTRKEILVRQIFLEALTWIPIMILSLIAYFYNLFTILPILLIISYGVLFYAGNLAVPSWFSWMGDIIPDKIRGEYFSKRNRICGTMTLIFMLAASFFLDYFKTKGLVLIAFAILFFISSLARIISTYLFTKQYEPKIRLEEGYYFSLLSFIKRLSKNNFGKFVIFVALISFAQFVAAPFFTVYMLKDLGFSYLWFTLITISGTIFNLISLPLLGKLSDKYGNKFIIGIGASLIPFIPILWLFSKNPYYLMLVPGFVGGVGWAAFYLGSNNFIYDSVTPQRRGIVFAYYNVIVGVGVLLGGLVGSFLAQYANITFMNNLLFIFLISGILRFLFAYFLLGSFKEVREVKRPKRIATTIIREIRLFHPHGLFHEPGWLKKMTIIKSKK